jgi:tetratricopeptide (TPR) repeat protein
MNRASQLSALADLDPANPILLCDLLDTLIASNDLAGVIARLDAAPNEVRDAPAVRFREARCAMLRGNPDEVIELFRPLVQRSSEPAFGIVHDLAYAQFVVGRKSEALETLKHVHAHGEDVVALALLKARILHHQQELHAALDVLAPIQASERLSEVHGLRALLWLDAGDSVRASSEAELALILDANQHEACIVIGTLTLSSRQFPESLLAFERAVASQPNSGRAWLGLAQNQMVRSDVPQARRLLERAIQYMPGNIAAWHALAWCQLMEGDLAGAKQSFEKAYALDRTFGETHGGFALVHALRAERKEAEESIKRALRLDPQGRGARYAQSVLLMDEGQIDKARAVVDRILAGTPGGVEVPADFIFRLRELVRPKG